MNHYKYARRETPVAIGTRTQKRIIALALVVLTAAVITLGVLYMRSANYQSATQQQIKKRIYSNVVDAIEQVNKLSGSVQSNSAAKLGLIRQYIYNADQLNEISMAVQGEKGRLMPDEAIEALFADIDIYEKLIQTATSSTLDARTTLLTHLTALQEMIK